MSFTKRDYEAIARIIHDRAISGIATMECRESDGYSTALRHIQGDLSRHFAADNPRFDPERFARACEPGGGK